LQGGAQPQPLTFGKCFDQTSQGVALPSFGECFNQSLQGVGPPSSLQPLTFGECFNQSLQRCYAAEQPATVDLYCRMLHPELARCCAAEKRAAVTFGECFNQSLQGVALPSSLRLVTFGECFNQSLEGITVSFDAGEAAANLQAGRASAAA
jgi:hypothetical protein